MRARATGAGESSKDHCIGLAGRVCSQILVCFARALCWEKAHIQAGGQTPPLRPRAQQRVRVIRSRSPPAGALSPAPVRRTDCRASRSVFLVVILRVNIMVHCCAPVFNPGQHTTHAHKSRVRCAWQALVAFRPVRSTVHGASACRPSHWGVAGVL